MNNTATILPERLAALDSLTLGQGNHSSFDDGHCAMEVVAWLADQGHTDAPACASPVLARYVIRLNDRWDFEQRQTLKPYLPRMIGTGGDGKDALREQIAAEWLTGRLLGPWLDIAGMGDHIAAIEGKTGQGLRDALRRIRTVAWAKRDASRAEMKAKIKARLLEQGKPDAAAVAAAAAAAAADDAAAAVAAAGPLDWWGKPYSAAYRAALAYYRERPLPAMGAITDLAAKQQPLALELLDALIDPVSA